MNSNGAGASFPRITPQRTNSDEVYQSQRSREYRNGDSSDSAPEVEFVSSIIFQILATALADVVA